jgi:hypothetical protein
MFLGLYLKCGFNELYGGRTQELVDARLSLLLLLIL